MTATGLPAPAPATPPPDPSVPSDPAGPARGPDLARVTGWLLGLIGFAVGARVITDNSFLTHLATGRLILETGSVPTSDPYSFLAPGETWTVQSWLVSVVYASLDATLGGWSIRVLHGLAGLAVTLGLWRLSTPARQLLTRIVLVGVALLIGTFLWPPRPLLVGLVATVAVLIVVREDKPRWWLVPVFWVWANSHGSFVLGCGLLGAMLVGAAIDERRVPLAEVRTVVWAGIGCLGAMISPLGWRLLWFPIHMMSRREALERVSEWSSPSFRSPVEQLFLVLLAAVVVAAVRGAPWRALVPSLLFLIGGLMAVRNLGLAAVVIVAMVAPSMAGLGGTVDGAIRGLVPRLGAVVVAAGLAVVGASTLFTEPVDLADYPVEELDWLEERQLVARPEVRLAQRDFVGNYLTLRYGSEARVFMDDRFDFYPLSVIADHNGLLVAGDYGEILDRNGFDAVLWATETPLRRWIDDDARWDVVLDGDDWFVACDTTSALYDRCSD